MQWESREGEVTSMILWVTFFVGCGCLDMERRWGHFLENIVQIRKGGSDLALYLAPGDQPCFPYCCYCLSWALKSRNDLEVWRCGRPCRQDCSLGHLRAKQRREWGSLIKWKQVCGEQLGAEIGLGRCSRVSNAWSSVKLPQNENQRGAPSLSWGRYAE